tara:strand:+ start:935 stop:1534 length:600 start_codon:yes stop_codon:yes gene_type:complete
VAKKQRLPARQPTRRPGIERYHRIIEAAEYLIVEKGSQVGLTLEAVAKQAGVPRVSLYYFFESVDALLDTLNQRAVQRMVAELPRPPATTDWQQLLSLYADSVRNFYLNNRLEMILALMPTSHESFHQASQEFGKALYDLLTANGAVPKSKKVARACDIIAGLPGLVWRKSFIETGTLTPAYHREAKRVTIAYMAAVLE